MTSVGKSVPGDFDAELVTRGAARCNRRAGVGRFQHPSHGGFHPHRLGGDRQPRSPWPSVKYLTEFE